MAKETVTLLGASGTLGHFAFQELWKRRARYDIVLLLRPSTRNKKLFRPHERQAGVPPLRGRGVAEGNGLKIVWGDVTCYEDLERAVCGTDWVLNAAGLISPEADYHPDRARAVNVDAIRHLLRAVAAQPGGAERIRLVHIGTVAETGDRLDCVHVGRVGDPIKVGVLDPYAASKVIGERAVLESSVRHWVSLRMTYIMPTDYHDYRSLLDPILFHMPLDSYMENITDRDAGYGLVQCLEMADVPGFWRRVYNMGGGPLMRCTAYDYLRRNFTFMGLSGLEAVAERRWFALRNFHLHYFEDSGILNDSLHHWRDSLGDYWQALYEDMPPGMKAVAFLCRCVPPVRWLAERITRALLRHMATGHCNGTAHWYRCRNDARISAYYRDYATYESIPDWSDDSPYLNAEPRCQRLDHGYDESKAQLELTDLNAAARFRGGECLSADWDGDLYTPVRWRCAFGHEFGARPYTVLKAGHWCPDCLPPPWRYDEEARQNPFLAQVWYPNHDPSENNVYAEEAIYDIVTKAGRDGRRDTMRHGRDPSRGG